MVRSTFSSFCAFALIPFVQCGVPRGWIPSIHPTLSSTIIYYLLHGQVSPVSNVEPSCVPRHIALPSFWPLESTSLTSDARYLVVGQEVVELESANARPITGYPSSM
ncbi:hypothetical protein BDR03DRAFT_305168 [Suillus americanus]|nr:hypothetical protein BDR03DRAFT_305168 [Suillus americanus]